MNNYAETMNNYAKTVVFSCYIQGKLTHEPGRLKISSGGIEEKPKGKAQQLLTKGHWNGPVAIGPQGAKWSGPVQLTSWQPVYQPSASGSFIAILSPKTIKIDADIFLQK